MALNFKISALFASITSFLDEVLIAILTAICPIFLSQNNITHLPENEEKYFIVVLPSSQSIESQNVSEDSESDRLEQYVLQKSNAFFVQSVLLHSVGEVTKLSLRKKLKQQLAEERKLLCGQIDCVVVCSSDRFLSSHLIINHSLEKRFFIRT